ncbi:MAG: alpha/beta hydrolase, partial [Actinomycetota bacterium]
AALWVDMRGVRSSEGYFSIEGWVRDATKALEVARSQPELRDLPAVFVGSSAGGAVATVATGRGARVEGLALLAAPASWVSFGSHPAQAVTRITGEAGMPLAPEVLADPEAWAAEFGAVTTVGAIGALAMPILVVHGTGDTVVPVGHAEVIAKAAPQAELLIIEGAEHQLRRDERAVDAVLAWMDRTLP